MYHQPFKKLILDTILCLDSRNVATIQIEVTEGMSIQNLAENYPSIPNSNLKIYLVMSWVE
jgi:hypothetical protein